MRNIRIVGYHQSNFIKKILLLIESGHAKWYDKTKLIICKETLSPIRTSKINFSTIICDAKLHGFEVCEYNIGDKKPKKSSIKADFDEMFGGNYTYIHLFNRYITKYNLEHLRYYRATDDPILSKKPIVRILRSSGNCVLWYCNATKKYCKPPYNYPRIGKWIEICKTPSFIKCTNFHHTDKPKHIEKLHKPYKLDSLAAKIPF